MKERCGECNGRGEVADYHGGCFDGMIICPECRGKGTRGYYCSTCHDSGKVASYHSAEFDGWVNCPDC